MPNAEGKLKWLITATGYFTKWIETESLASIKERDVQKFTWKIIITRFEIPRALVSYNET